MVIFVQHHDTYSYYTMYFLLHSFSNSETDCFSLNNFHIKKNNFHIKKKVVNNSLLISTLYLPVKKDHCYI